MNLRGIVILALFFSPLISSAQPEWPLLQNGRFLNPSDITMPYDHLDFKGELYDFVNGNIWKFSLSGGISLFHDKHELGVDIPFVRSEYTGIENLLGIGDIVIRWKILTYESINRVRTLASSALSLEVSIPTGEEFNGHGAGVTILTPGFVLCYRPVDRIGIFPQIKYTHSLGEASSEWGGAVSGGISVDPEDISRKIRAMQAEILFNVEFSKSWVGVAPVYLQDFDSGEGTLNIRPELGILFAESISLKLSGSFFIAGRRRLLSWTMFTANYYF
jgi:hypothetical protein